MHVLQLVFLLLVKAYSEQVVLQAVPQPAPAGAQQPVVQQPAVIVLTPQSAADAAASAAKSAASAAQAAAVAANTAASAAASAHSAANAAASANTAATSAVQRVIRTNAADTAATQAQATVPTPAQAVAPLTAAPNGPVSIPVAPAVPLSPSVAPVPPGSYWSGTQWFMQLIAGLTFAAVVKGLCIIGNVLVQISPFPQVSRWESRKCTGEADAAPYVSIAFGGCQWCFYGMFAWLVTGRSGFLILVQSNCLGALLGTHYVRTFYCNCRNEAALVSLQKYLSAVTSLALLQVCAIGVLPAERALFLTGLVSSFCSFIGATSVLVTVPVVMRTKDSRSIPGPYAIANLSSALVWSLCGYLLEDPLVTVPNLFSAFCSAVSLGLKVYFPSDVFAFGGEKSEKLSSVEDGTGVPAKGQFVSMKALRKPSEFTPLKLSASKCEALTEDIISCDASARLREKLASMQPVNDPSARLREKIAGADAVPMSDLSAVGEGTGGTGETW